MKFSSNRGRPKDVRLKEYDKFPLRLPKHYKKTIEELVRDKFTTSINDTILLALNNYFQLKGYPDHDRFYDI